MISARSCVKGFSSFIFKPLFSGSHGQLARTVARNEHGRAGRSHAHGGTPSPSHSNAQSARRRAFDREPGTSTL